VKLHDLLHVHHLATKAGVGQFEFCEPRLPFGRGSIAFRPDCPAARWHPVPSDRDYRDGGQPLVTGMLHAADAAEAMKLLREASYASAEKKYLGRR
jgi:hypothetical protein